MDVDFEKALRLFIIKKNQLKMVKKRGYDIMNEEPLFNYKLDNFIEYYYNNAKKNKKSVRQLLSTFYKGIDKDLYVFFADVDNKHKQLGVEAIGEMLTEMESRKIRNSILITPMPLSSSAKKKISELLSYNIYVFSESEMSYDPTEHYFVPEHRPLAVEEQRDFLARNKISIDQMPIMLTSDMIARYYGFKPGQIIEIRRTNLFDTLVPHSLSYRAVKEE